MEDGRPKWVRGELGTGPLGVSTLCWEQAATARAAGAAVSEIVARLWLSGADVPRARLLVRKMPAAETRVADAADSALVDLARTRTWEVLLGVFDVHYATVVDKFSPAITQLESLEAETDSIAAQLTNTRTRLLMLMRVSIGTSRRNALLHQSFAQARALQEKYQRIRVRLNEIDELLAAMTSQIDTGLLSCGYSVDQILALGGPPRSARSVYRRRGENRRTQPPGPIEDTAARTGWTNLINQIETAARLHAAWVQTLSHRTDLLSRFIADPLAMEENEFAALVAPVGPRIE